MEIFQVLFIISGLLMLKNTDGSLYPPVADVPVVQHYACVGLVNFLIYFSFFY
jgi:hypothetical protein